MTKRTITRHQGIRSNKHLKSVLFCEHFSLPSKHQSDTLQTLSRQPLETHEISDMCGFSIWYMFLSLFLLLGFGGKQHQFLLRQTQSWFMSASQRRVGQEQHFFAVEFQYLKKINKSCLLICLEQVIIYLKSIKWAVIFHEEVLLLADREVVAELAQQVCQVDRLDCWENKYYEDFNPLVDRIDSNSIQRRAKMLNGCC